MPVFEFPDRPTPGLEPEPAFDRFYFNLYAPPTQPDTTFAVLGGSIYPPAGVIDGYVCVAHDGEQRNLRVSDELDRARFTTVGPLAWDVLEPGRRWSLRLDANPSGVELDLEWSARAPVYEIPGYEALDESGTSRYDHCFQSGHYAGTITIDGRRISVDGWQGQRDRSRGTRRVRDRLGMHLWVQVQFGGECVGFLFNEARDGSVAHCAGGLLRDNGTVVELVGLEHDLAFTDELELLSGRLRLRLADGSTRELEVVNTGRGIYMTGGGYADFHGVPIGTHCIQHERWRLDGSRTPRTLALSMTDALCEVRDGATAGRGIFEYGLSRSAAFRYRPTLGATQPASGR
jgi:hypothetical protein